MPGPEPGGGHTGGEEQLSSRKSPVLGSALRETPYCSSVDPWLLNLVLCPREATHLWSFFGCGPPRTKDAVVHLTHGYLLSVGVMCPGTGIPGADSSMSHWCRSARETLPPVPSFLVIFCLPRDCKVPTVSGTTPLLPQHALPLWPFICLEKLGYSRCCASRRHQDQERQPLAKQGRGGMGTQASLLPTLALSSRARALPHALPSSLSKLSRARLGFQKPSSFSSTDKYLFLPV